jgi:hypothetical protein
MQQPVLKVNGQTGIYTFSDNFYRLLGEDHFEPKLSSVIKFIHPDDLDYVIERHNGSFNRRNYQYYVSVLYIGMEQNILNQ